jgi:TPP-dependent pyruvate/acetoin dehydrogenase alpha subunit
MTTGLDVTSAGKLPGAVHLYIGEEAVAAGLEVVDTHQVGAAPER